MAGAPQLAGGGEPVPQRAERIPYRGRAEAKGGVGRSILFQVSRLPLRTTNTADVGVFGQ
jgi:hypothetical protein